MDPDKQILVVDDLLTCRIIKQQLENLGYQGVSYAEDGQDALAILEQGALDLLIADWNVPDLPGIEILKSIRSNSKCRDLPVILMHCVATPDSVVLAAKSGVSGYVVKPFTAKTLQKKIGVVLENSIQRRQIGREKYRQVQLAWGLGWWFQCQWQNHQIDVILQ